MPNQREDFIRVLAQQSYSFHLLVKVMRERELLKPGEPMNLWNEQEFEKFLVDFRGNYFPSTL